MTKGQKCSTESHRKSYQCLSEHEKQRLRKHANIYYQKHKDEINARKRKIYKIAKEYLEK